MAGQQGVDAHSVPDSATASQLHDDNYTFIAQYIDQNDSNETSGSAGFEQSADGPQGGHLTAAEAKAEIDAGLQIVSIFETNGEAVSPYEQASANSTPNEIMPYLQGTTTYQGQTVSQGYADGKEAVASAQAVKQPTGSAIYFALDFDPGVGNYYPGLQQAVETYLKNVDDALAGSGYTLGVYGAAQTLQWATTSDPANNYTSNVSYTWLSGSSGWAGYGPPGTEGSEISGPGSDTSTHGWSMLQSIPGDPADTNPNEQSSNAPNTSLGVDYDNTSSSSFGQWSTQACYLAGTRILTDRDEVAVEDLRIGDRVVTASGVARPIKWIGTRAYSARFARNNADAHPVCFKAGSIANSKPNRDLWVSPKHAMFVDGVLVPAELLVNGVTILRPVPRDEVRYYHVELDSHDLLVANGAAAESFVDADNRGMFQNAASYSARYPTEQPRETAYCARRVEQGAALAHIRKRLDLQASLIFAA